MEGDPLISSSRTGLVRHRYVISMFVFTGLALVYALRVNLSVAIIAMAGKVSRNSSVTEGTCIVDAPGVSRSVRGDFEWSEETKTMVLGAFFYGYLSSQIPGGIMATKLSVKWVFGYGIFLTSILSVATEWVARWNVNAFIALRVLEGVTEGVTIPSMYVLISRWAPKNERTSIAMLCTVGTNIGTVVTMPITAALSDSSLGWPASFYIPGVMGIIWSLGWYYFITSQPENHRWISDQERDFIISNRETSYQSSKQIPWIEILTSRSVWVYSVTRLLSSVTFYMFLTEMPSFVDDVFGVALAENGLLNGAFHIIYAGSMLGSGILSDYMIQKNILSRTNIRKLFQVSSFILGGVMLILVTLAGCNYTAVVILLCIASGSIALSGGGESSMALDIAPDYAGSVAAVGNMVGNISAIVATNLVLLTHDHERQQRGWNMAFLGSAGLSFAGALLFGILGTAHEESWSKRLPDFEIPKKPGAYRPMMREKLEGGIGIDSLSERFTDSLR